MINAHRWVPGVAAAAVLCAGSAYAQDANSESLFISSALSSPLSSDAAGAEGVIFEAVPADGAAQKPQTSVPPVEHTGLETLAKDIIEDFKALPQRESTWVILGVGGAAAL